MCPGDKTGAARLAMVLSPGLSSLPAYPYSGFLRLAGPAGLIAFLYQFFPGSFIIFPVPGIHIFYAGTIRAVELLRIGIQHISHRRIRFDIRGILFFLFLLPVICPGCFDAVPGPVINSIPACTLKRTTLKRHPLSFVLYRLRFHPNAGSHQIIPLNTGVTRYITWLSVSSIYSATSFSKGSIPSTFM